MQCNFARKFILGLFLLLLHKIQESTKICSSIRARELSLLTTKVVVVVVNVNVAGVVLQRIHAP